MVAAIASEPPTAKLATSSSKAGNPPNKPPVKTTTSPDPPPDPSSNNSSDSTLVKSIKTVKEFNEKYSPFIAWASLLTGLANFAYINIKETESLLANIATTAFSKVALFTNGLYGFLENVEKKNAVGATGYGGDLLTSILSESKNTYFVRFFSTALDQFPALLTDFKVKYKKFIKETLKEEPEDFTKFKSYGESLNKSWIASKEVFRTTAGEVYQTFKEKGLLAGIKDFFSLTRADGNILSSSIGVLASGAIGVLGMFTRSELVEKLGRVGRIVEGFHCDYGVAIKNFSIDPETGKPAGGGNSTFGLSGLAYIFAGLLDFGNIWKPEKGFHYASLGTDRYAAYLLAKAQAQDNKTQTA